MRLSDTFFEKDIGLWTDHIDFGITVYIYIYMHNTNTLLSIQRRYYISA